MSKKLKKPVQKETSVKFEATDKGHKLEVENLRFENETPEVSIKISIGKIQIEVEETD